MNKILLLLTLTISLFAVEPVKVGSHISILDDYEYETPKGHVMKVPPKSELIIAAFNKDSAALVNDYLETKDKFYTQKNNTVFISDISKMPTVIINMFAIPKLKKFKHRIYLHYGDNFRDLIPNQKDKVTLLKVKDGNIQTITYVTTANEIQEAIENR